MSRKMIARVMSVIIIVVTLISSLASSSRTVYASSDERISAFINMASGKSGTGLGSNISLSERDLRFLGVYISNFFVPFGTELGTNDDVTSINKEDIQKALQTNLNFDDATAMGLTETLIGLSRSSATEKELVICVSKEYQKDLRLLSFKGSNIPLNAYTATSCLLGGLKQTLKYCEKAVLDRAGVSSRADIPFYQELIEGNSYKYGYFAYKEGNKYIPVFDFMVSNNYGFTPSSAAFIKCLESVDIEMGYGFNFFDFTLNEMGSSQSDYQDKIDTVSESALYTMSIYGSMVKVDCFGNIIFMGGNHQFVAVPACMNPYVWVEVDKLGNDIGSGMGGTAYNIISIPSMSLCETGDDKGNALFSGNPIVDSENKTIAIESKEITSKLKKVAFDLDYGEYTLRKVRGSKDYKLNGTVLFVPTGGTSYLDLAKKVETGFRSAYPGWIYTYNSYRGGIDTNIGWNGKVTEGIDIIGPVLSKDSTRLTGESGKYVKYLDSFVFVDNLGAFHFDDDKKQAEFNTFNVESYFGNSVESFKNQVSTWSKSQESGFSNTYKNIKNGKMVVPESFPKEGMMGIYLTYAYASLYEPNSDESRRDTIGKLGYRLNTESFPSIPDKALKLPEQVVEDLAEKSIRNWIYYLLHPTEGFEYVKLWLKNTVNNFLLGWHDDMVGTNGSGSINGTTKYRGFSGYVTTPELFDIPWLSSLLGTYTSMIPFFLIIMVLFMLIAYITGVLSFQKALIGLIILSMGLSLPPSIINGIVGTSNRFASNIYGEKFTYWALVQHESYSTAIDEAASGNNYGNYLRELYSKNSSVNTNQGGESIMLKWQAPKKMSSLMLTKDDKDLLNSFNSSLMNIGGLLNSTYSGESYLDNTDSVYLYRSYIDIANFSRYIHRGLENGFKQPINQNITNDMMSHWSNSLQDAIRNLAIDYEDYRQAGYANLNGDGSSSAMTNNIIRIRLPLSSKLVNEQLANIGTIDSLGLGEYVGINQEAFSFSIPMFNVGQSKLEFKVKLGNSGHFNTSGYSNEDFSALAAYGLMSENPFYYFSWYLYESGMSEETYERVGYRNLLLGSDNAGFFYNTQGNGEMKDFMDLKSLFTYIIPYLRECNELVLEWDNVYGIYLHDGVPFEEGHQDDPDIKGNPELEQKYWHNLNVARLYNMYSPWVDIMYDCSYAKEEKISYLGEEYVISDPINPNSYPDERPMVFSRSEMLDYGLKENNLTKVEKLIIECEEGMQERMFSLLNYHSFNDVTLNTAAAINCAFEFNETFSENSLLGSNRNIYPQSFELNDFSYDAFLRFILSNTTSESMIVSSNENFYENVVNSSSMTTIIVMLVLDILAMYVIPAFKMFFLVGIFIISILLVFITALRVDSQQRYIKSFLISFFKPLISFLLVTCGMAVVVSWFMGEGNTSVTGSMETSISLGDPVMVMLVMIAINVIVIILYFKIVQSVFKDIKNKFMLLATFMGGVVGSFTGKLGSIANKLSNRFNDGTDEHNISTRGSSHTNSRASSRGISVDINDRENTAEDGSNENRRNRRRNIFDRNSDNSSSGRSSSGISESIRRGLDRLRSSSRENESDVGTDE